MLVAYLAFTTFLEERKLQPAMLREIRFAAGATRIYSKLKLAQAHIAFCRLAGEGSSKLTERWDSVHEGIGADLYALCASLGGAYVKIGQFFSTRPDLVPEQWCRQLGWLCDAVQPMDSSMARAIAEHELSISSFCQRISHWVDKPLGSASVAQVHAARITPMTLRSTPWWQVWRRSDCSRWVAIKVRRPETVALFARDLKAVCQAAAVLQLFELSFDLIRLVISPICCLSLHHEASASDPSMYAAWPIVYLRCSRQAGNALYLMHHTCVPGNFALSALSRSSYIEKRRCVGIPCRLVCSVAMRCVTE